MRDLVLTRGPQVRRAVLLAVVAGVPVLFLRVTNDLFSVPKLALLLLGVALAAGVRAAEVLQGARPRLPRALVVPAGAVALPLAVAWLASPYLGWSTFGLYSRFQGFVPYILVIALGLLLLDAFGDDPAPIAWALVYSGAVVGAYALVQVAGLDPLSWRIGEQSTNAALSTLGNPNFTGGFLGIVLPLAWGLWLYDVRRRSRSVKLIAIIAGGWIVSFSQGGWAAGVAGVAVVAGLVYGARRDSFRRLGFAAAGAVAVIAVATATAGALAPQSTVIPETVKARGGWWQAALSMAGDSPLLGRGPNTFAIEGVQHRVLPDALRSGYNFADDPHSVFLSMLTAAGVLGGIGFVALLGWFVWRLVTTGANANVLQFAFLGAGAAYFVQSLVSIDELSLRVALWAVLAGTIASEGLPARAPAPRRKAATRRKKRSGGRRGAPADTSLRAWPAVALTAAVVAAAAWWSLSFVVADARVAAGVVLIEDGRIEEGRADIEAALAFRDEYKYREIYGNALRAAGLVAEAEQAFSYLDDFPDVQALVNRARNLHRVDPPSTEAQRLDALSIYRRAIELDPLNPFIRVEASDVLVALGRYEDAIDELAPAVAAVTPDDHPQVWGALALARAHLGDEAGALDALEIAAALDPDEPHVVQARRLLSQEPS